MTGRTHLAVGVAAALLAAGPAAGLAGLAVAAAGGAVGAVLPDLDVRDTAHPWRERLTRAGAAALLAGTLVFDAANGTSLAREAVTHGVGPLSLGAVGLVALACAARLSAHRSFSHSLLALAGFAAATHLVCAPLAPYTGSVETSPSRRKRVTERSSERVLQSRLRAKSALLMLSEPRATVSRAISASTRSWMNV